MKRITRDNLVLPLFSSPRKIIVALIWMEYTVLIIVCSKFTAQDKLVVKQKWSTLQENVFMGISSMFSLSKYSGYI